MSYQPTLKQIQDDRLRDTTTSSIALRDQRTRDFLQRTSEDINGTWKLTDALDLCWSAGRSNQNGGSNSTVKPYMRHRSYDGRGSAGGSVNTSNGKVRWYNNARMTSPGAPGACYGSSWFYAGPEFNGRTIRVYGTVRDSYSVKPSGSTQKCQFEIIGFQNGYLSGGSKQYHLEDLSISSSGRSYSGDFTVDPSYRYILVSWSAWISGTHSSGAQELQLETSNMRAELRP